VSNAWSAPTSFDTVCRRAGGRSAYNAWRHAIRELRRSQVAKLLSRYPPLERGTVRGIARELGVHPSTVCRDIKALLRQIRPCSQCGHFAASLGPEEFPGLVERILVPMINSRIYQKELTLLEGVAQRRSAHV